VHGFHRVTELSVPLRSLIPTDFNFGDAPALKIEPSSGDPLNRRLSCPPTQDRQD
jgi:hypothetical protein